MKRILSICLLMSSIIAFAHAEGKQYVGVQLGFTQPITRLNLPVHDQEKNLTPTVLNGFKVGVVYDATIVKGFGYTLGLNYTFGAKTNEWEKDGENGYPRIQKQELYHQLEIPVDWQYKFEIANNTYLMLYTGPTLQVGLSYKQSTRKQLTPSEDIASVDKDVYTMDGVFALKRLNVTWGVGAGLQYERYFLRGGYDFGLINPYKEATFHVSDDYNPYTRGRFDQWQIKIGMYLWEF